MSGYTILCMFLVYGFAGWVFETIYTLAKTKKFVNKGFLQGPVLAAYGLAPVAVSAALIPFESLSGWITCPLTVIISFAAAFVFEFTSALVFKKMFSKDAWDRQNSKSNLIKNLVLGAVLSLVMIFVQPSVEKLIDKTISHKMLLFLTAALIILFVDTIYSVSEAINIKTKISAAKEIEQILNEANPDDSIKIYAKTDSLGEDRAEFNKKTAKYKRFIVSNNFAYSRLNTAYPLLNQQENLKLLEDLRYMYYLISKN
ncbi:MAG: putative ABC transporter permease [Clostridia bacterium]|nr:putative ABC transporter permease [Clostridia bacterium]